VRTAFRAFVALVLVLFVLGCATEVVKLRHPGTGEAVQCGPYVYTGPVAHVAINSLNRCLDDYQRQGYMRVPQ